jgi:hypothetical protein
MKKIGFIDYFLDEWHANNYPEWIDKKNLGFRVTDAWAAMDKPGGLSTKEWCKKFGIEQALSQEELIEKCDYIVILSPDNPEQHEKLSELSLKSGKPTYIDKTFATNFAEAVRMFDLAEKYNTPMYSTSALRYAQELTWLREESVKAEEIELISSRGPGAFPNYSIHQLEMIVSTMGPGAKRVIATNSEKAPVVLYEYADGRTAVVNHLPWSGFSLAVHTKGGKGKLLDITRDFWGAFIDDMLSFFADASAKVPKAETLSAIAMYEAGIKAIKKPGEWVNVQAV